MKKILNIVGMLCLLIILSCKKDKVDNVSTTISDPSITAPTSGTIINLVPSSNAIVNFEWKAAQTANYTLPFYKVVFDKENGDFSKPIYIGTPAKVGSENKLALSHKEMNKIANAAGIAELATGKVKWRVEASNGVVSSISGSSILQLTRPSGFAENPLTLFITGTATEGGNDLAKALPFKRLSDGVFEIYTALNSGNYKLVDKIIGTPLNLIIDAGTVKEGTEVKSPTVTKKVYRINVDFNNSVATFTEIQSVGLWFSGYNAITSILSYDAAGVWKVSDIAIVWKTESWGKDERYKFRVTEKDAAGTVVVKNWGSSNKDNSRATSSSPASYFLLKEVDNSQYDYTYKFAAESQKTDIEFRLGATADYTHKVTFK
ncbi:SusE domain-containing protein [Pedobacter sp.]|uniref:SusE domain-containing protein n=1 Tax=Pedobacter sp. TaxID=1411316 RepID=UPI002C1425D7|nr:SusE domain-containing protein [Pedobacter sp.]HWW43235.1 SusE domain-containing protein [Pedobacter sp.]